MWGTDGARVLTVDDGWGLDLRGHRPLECRVCGMARVQGGATVSPPSSRSRKGSGAAAARSRRTRRARPVAPDGPRQPVSVGPLPQPGPLLGHPPQLRLAQRAGDQRRRRTLESHAQGTAVYGRVFQISPTCAPPSPSSSSATTGAGASRSWPIARHSRPARSTSYAKPRSPNLCPRSRVRYTRPLNCSANHCDSSARPSTASLNLLSPSGSCVP